MNAIRIHAASAPAAGLLAALQSRCLDDPWSTESFRDLLAMPGAVALLAETGAEGGAVPVGFAMFAVAAGRAELHTLGVLPEYRRRGAGRRMLAAMLKMAKAAGARRVFLEVAETNAAAIALYRGAGFSVSYRCPGYYQRPGTAHGVGSRAALVMRYG